MRFKRALQRYGRTPEPETPYQRAGQLWDERIGSARVQARNWRLMAFGGMFLTVGLAGALVWQSMQSRVVPYVVEVDQLGEARAVVPADAEFRPTDPQIAWHLSRFIMNIRSKSLDAVLMRENWLSAYDFVTDRGSLFLGEYARQSDPFAGIGEKTVSVQVTSVVRASETSFQVKWTETRYERGALAGTSRWTAILTVQIRPPRSADTLRKNPLGLYVDAVAWSRELDTPSAPANGAGAPGRASPDGDPPPGPGAADQRPPAPGEAPAFAPAPADTSIPRGSPLDPGSSAPPQYAPERTRR